MRPKKKVLLGAQLTKINPPLPTNGVVYITEAELASNNYRRRLAKLRKVKYGDFDIKAVSLVSPAGILISFT
jgi:hypothetical protein